MEASEIRIGNAINYKGNYHNYKGCTNLNEHLFAYLLDVNDEWDLIEPIPLTEDWLLKFGFKKVNGMYYLDLKEGSELCLIDDNFYIFGLDCPNEQYATKVYIKYVHQLQNIYFALTGEELKIK